MDHKRSWEQVPDIGRFKPSLSNHSNQRWPAGHLWLASIRTNHLNNPQGPGWFKAISQIHSTTIRGVDVAIGKAGRKACCYSPGPAYPVPLLNLPPSKINHLPSTPRYPISLIRKRRSHLLRHKRPLVDQCLYSMLAGCPFAQTAAMPKSSQCSSICKGFVHSLLGVLGCSPPRDQVYNQTATNAASHLQLRSWDAVLQHLPGGRGCASCPPNPVFCRGRFQAEQFSYIVIVFWRESYHRSLSRGDSPANPMLGSDELVGAQSLRNEV